MTTTDSGEIIVTNNEHCHTEIRQHLRKDYKIQKLNHQITNNLMNFSSNRRINYPLSLMPTIATTTTSIMPITSMTNASNSRKVYQDSRARSGTSSSSQNDSPPPLSTSTTPKSAINDNTPNNRNTV